jgi:hypothetical protein
LTEVASLTMKVLWWRWWFREARRFGGKAGRLERPAIEHALG